MVKKKINNEEIPVELTEEEVGYVLKFADALNASIYGTALTPMLLNQRMKDISLNPMQATEVTLTDAMNSPKDSELVLQAFSQDFEIQSQPYRRLLSYLGNMLSFDLTLSCNNAKETDYKTPKYNKDLDVVKSFLDRFDYKKEFTLVVNQLLRNEAFFSCPRFDTEQIVLQELPSSPMYTLITGRWSYGLLFSLNMYWFLQPGVDLDMYPSFLKKKYGEIWGTSEKRPSYLPSMSPENRGISSWVYWQDIPTDVGWCWKMNPAMVARVPYFSGLFLDLIQQSLMRGLQKNLNMSAAARIILGEIPMLKEQASKVKDAFAITPANLGNFLSLVKSAIGDSLKTAALPLNNIQGISFPLEEKLYSSYLKTALASSGVNTNLIFTNELKMNTIETQLSLNVDEQLMYALYPQFNAFLNYYVNKLTGRFKFNFEFEGTNFFNNRQQRLEKQTTLLGQGIVLPQKIAAAIGMNPFSFQRQMEEAKAMGWVDKLTPIVPAFQQPNSEGGRPKKSETEISDEGEQTRSTGGNIGRGGKEE